MLAARRITFDFCHSGILKNPRFLFSINKLYELQFVTPKYPLNIRRTHNFAINATRKENQKKRAVNKFVLRTHTCGELTLENVGQNVRLSGWLEFERMGKFLTLRDAYGATQLIIPDHKQDLQKVVENLPYESVLSVTGAVIQRPAGQENKRMHTGDIEIEVESLEVLNSAKVQLPILPREFDTPTEIPKMKYRYLALRHPTMQRNLRMRSEVIAKMREYLIKECHFVDIETPTLFKSTPGGAQEFVVPTQHPGKFYSLVQSPQQLKQLLMVGGFDRYFQIARCYRDESIRHDRQPEFTQLDIEMSFADQEGIMELIEGLLAYCWPDTLKTLSVPFKRLTYTEAMETYGTDQPDLRIPYQIRNLTKVFDYSVLLEIFKEKFNETDKIYALVFPQKAASFTKSVRERMFQTHKTYFSDVKLLSLTIKSDHKQNKLRNLYTEIMKEHIKQELHLNEEDVLLLAIGQEISAPKLLGKLRLEFARHLESKGEVVHTSETEILWITDFPLFELEDTTKNLKTMHHPFTQPHPDDMKYLNVAPMKMRGLHYDLVMNGSEIAGGSIRIHSAKLQEQIFDMLNISNSSFTYFLDALASGAPPHGGIAIGLDRFFSLLCKTSTIKDVIAFPKTAEGRDLMTDAPCEITENEKSLYHIEIVNKS